MLRQPAEFWFQFQTGSIKSLLGGEDLIDLSTLRFNSKLVRLKVVVTDLFSVSSVSVSIPNWFD